MNKGKESKIGRKWRASRWEGMDKIERNTDNYENLTGCFPSTLNLVSPLFLLLPDPLVLALHVLSSLRSWPRSSDPPTVGLFSPPVCCLRRCLLSSLHLRHIFS